MTHYLQAAPNSGCLRILITTPPLPQTRLQLLKTDLLRRAGHYCGQEMYHTRARLFQIGFNRGGDQVDGAKDILEIDVELLNLTPPKNLLNLYLYFFKSQLIWRRLLSTFLMEMVKETVQLFKNT